MALNPGPEIRVAFRKQVLKEGLIGNRKAPIGCVQKSTQSQIQLQEAAAATPA